MAEASVAVDQNQFSCPICLDLLKDPVTTSCGHNYCMRCIKSCWDQEDHAGVYSCPQCRQTFTSRPVLGRNTMLAEVVENLKKTATADVECDICTGRKRKAVKSCLVCLASYCEIDLQLHNKLHSAKQHKLIDAISHLKDKVCSQHVKPLEIYCRTDQQCICYLCTMDEHRGHDTVSAAAGREEIQTQIGEKQREFQQGIQTREKELQELREAVGSFTRSAQSAVKDSENIFIEIIRSIKKRRSDVRELIRDQEKAAVDQAEGHMERLEKEIDELKRRHSELEQLSHTEDHIHVLQRCQDVPVTPEAGFGPRISVSSQSCFGNVRMVISELKDQLENVCEKKTAEIHHTVTKDTIPPVSVSTTRSEFLQSTEVTMSPVSVPRTTAGFLQSTKVSMSPVSVPRTTAGFLPFTKVTMSSVSVPRTTAGFLPSTKVTMSPVSVPRTTAGFLPSTKVTMSPVSVPRTTAGFLQYSCQLTLDPNTAHRYLSLSEGNRKVTWGAEQPYPDHLERFDWWDQILCKESFTSHAYWEAEWSGGGAEIGVTYKGIGRKGWSDDCRLGMNDKSWMLSCSPCRYSVCHNNKEIDIPIKPSDSRRVGVYLDWEADTLSFYRVSSEGLTLLYSFTSSFTEPLCPAFWVYYAKSSVSLCMLG
ncbi:E3 ubiquitin/ISG15 ligase TRIM25-like isoform X2 [Brienomyrus brachyistius]|uniref:E3 ubiquitin/ISG15 ligase TRIM25-like isoform X2 n=1 Tax=Brienomyrus brachyistius TaxID=42636 RepID=UPI0020B3262C|nr:E3 ubiquitin/ISG15 ligase TRIM25-like isoform X2 [Brienomyrus brachyistius]